MYSGSNLDENNQNLVYRSGDDNTWDSEAEGQEFMKSIAEVLSIFETTREPNFEDLAKIINNIILHQIQKPKSKNSLKP